MRARKFGFGCGAISCHGRPGRSALSGSPAHLTDCQRSLFENINYHSKDNVYQRRECLKEYKPQPN
jgi:hypothetical protein